MDYINIVPLISLMKRLPKGSSFTNYFNNIKESYGLNIKNMKPQQVQSLAKRINKRQMVQRQQQRLSWAFGQLKVFNCVAIYQSMANDKEIREFANDEISQINSIFRSKTKLFIQYQIRVLANLRQTALKSWTEEQLAFLSDAVDENTKTEESKQSEDKINWKGVSFRIFQRSKGLFFHNLNHCREMWNNHINPRVNKQQWSIDEDILLFTLVIQFGPRWSKIAKHFNHSRTEHMVKNRYNRFFKIWKKNSDFEREASSEVIQLKFSKAHLKRLEAKRVSSGGERNCDIEKDVGIQIEPLRQGIPNQLIIEQHSILFNQVNHLAGQEKKTLKSSQGKNSPEKEKQIRNDEFIKQQQHFHQQIYGQKTVQCQDYRQPNIIQPQICQIYIQQQQKQQWQYYPFLQLYLPKGIHQYHQFF